MTEILQQPDSLAGGLTFFGGLFLAAMVGLTFYLSRRHAMMPLLATVCYMPLGQEIVIGGFNFYIIRLLILAGVVRVIFRGELRILSRNRLDRMFYWWAFASLVLGSLSMPSWPLLTNRLGAFYNAVGIYFLATCWIRDTKTFVGLVKGLAILVIPIAISMVVEKTTTRNIFSMFGGVPEITVQREGHLRCQAAFRHPILAGTFGATIFPLFVGLWFQGEKEKRLAVAGCVSAFVITLTSASSGPFLNLLLGGLGFAFWPLRYRMFLVRRSIVALLLVLAVYMHSPVWYVFARVSSVTGGTGWYRSWLIDQAVAHAGEWWLFGSTYTAHWGREQVLDDDPNNVDITNQFIGEGLRGGLLKVVLFVAIIVHCFKLIGRGVRRETRSSPATGIMFWAMGVTLFTHCLSFMTVTYFDQMVVVWVWLLAAISGIVACGVHQARIRSMWMPETAWSQVTENPAQPSQGVFQ